MTRILVVYGTTEGQTRKIASQLGIALRRFGVEADVFMASPTAPSPEGYAGIIVAASPHAGKYQRPVQKWIRANAAGLAGKPGAFISVCLAVKDTREKTQLSLHAIMRDFVESCGWVPAYVKPVAGALAYTKYGWLTKCFMKRMAAKNGGDTDTTRDHEYTDWADVRAFAREFAVGVQDRTSASNQHVA
jgi:menaquinone-dependent protoporphyrinogen oxidase